MSAPNEKAQNATKQAIIITVFNSKGGCGKTMTSMQLAGEFAVRGIKGFVIDMDPQNSSSLWRIAAPAERPFPAEVLSLAPLKEAFIDKLDQITRNHDVVIIDCPPSLTSRVPWVSLLVSDLAIIPIVPVMDNIWASGQSEELVKAAQKENRALKGAYLLSMVRRGKLIDQCISILQDKALLPILNSKLSMRNAFPESQIFGCTVSAFGKSAASDEIQAVVEEVAKLTGLKLNRG